MKAVEHPSKASSCPENVTTPESRTTGSHGRFCSLCGGPIKGRRRNGFCSDRCRLRTTRKGERARIRELFTEIEAAVAELQGAVIKPSRSERRRSAK
jgi:predicted nucleic acid-binding Zn ribbon protein